MPMLVQDRYFRPPVVRAAPALPTERASVRRTRRAGLALVQAYAELDAAVLAMRAEGASWAQVGAALGMTKQSARNRFIHVEDPA